MRVAHAFAGLSLAQGDDLRRAISHARDDEEFRSLERGFVAHARRAGADQASARAVWRELTRFAAYAFCHAHAAGYGTLGWHSAYLKTHFPAEWAVGVLNHHAGMYPMWVHVEDLRREGVRFLAPCVRSSSLDATFENGAVRVGLARVFALSAATGARIVCERGARPFASLQDFLERARPSADEVDAAGALGSARRARSLAALAAARGARGGLAGAVHAQTRRTRTRARRPGRRGAAAGSGGAAPRTRTAGVRARRARARRAGGHRPLVQRASARRADRRGRARRAGRLAAGARREAGGARRSAVRVAAGRDAPGRRR